MEPLSVIAAVALLGYYIFRETPEQRVTIEKAAAEYERRHIQNEIEERRREAEKRDREKPFATAEECLCKEYVSYARISTYCSCPRRFKLIYLDKMRRCDTGFHYREKGSVLHKSLERCLRPYVGRTISELDKQQIVRAAYDLGYLQDSKTWWSEGRRERAKARRKTFRDNVKFVCATLPKPVEVVGVEHELKFQLDGLNFYGIVDLVLRYPDGHFEIVDYKTGLRHPIKEQLEIYSIPFYEASTHSSISFRIICVDRESHYIWTHNVRDKAETTSRILTLVRTIINDKSYPPVIGSHCRDCSASSACDHSRRQEAPQSKKVLHRVPLLTKLGSAMEWRNSNKHQHRSNVMVVDLPEWARDGKEDNEQLCASDHPSAHDQTVKSIHKTGQGLSFSLSRAKRQYRCLKTDRQIKRGEYHFVDHKGRRYCLDAFREMYPERAMLLMKEREPVSTLRSVHPKRGARKGQ